MAGSVPHLAAIALEPEEYRMACKCCCSPNCSESYCVDCDNSSVNCPTYGPSCDLYACIKRTTHLPWDGCSNTTPPTPTRFLNDAGGTFTRTIKTCVKSDGTICMNLAGTKAKLRNDTDVYISFGIKNGTTSCISFVASCVVAGLPDGCRLQWALVGLNGLLLDCQFQYPQYVSSNGRFTVFGHCAGPCLDYSSGLFCWAFRIDGPCSKCKKAVVTLSDFYFTVQCPDQVPGHCTGIDDGCAAGWGGCPMCCECCIPNLGSEFTKYPLTPGTKYCCENNFYLLSSGSYGCSIYNPYGNCSNHGLDDCRDNAPSSYVKSCTNNPSGQCVLTRSVYGEFLYNYPCLCTYSAGPPTQVTNCAPAGIYYKGTDDCDNNREPCDGSGGSGC